MTGQIVGQTDAPGWLAARQYGVPARMMAEATRQRLAGDWRGACAAAGFDVRTDLAEVRGRYGADVAARVEEDLRALAPDLARWHLPRQWRGGSGLLEPNLHIVLSGYGEAALSLRTPAHLERPQRVELRIGPAVHRQDGVERWDRLRYLWDATAAHLLLPALAGGDRAPFFHRDGRRLTAAELPTRTPVDDPVALAEWVTILQDAGEFEQAWAAAGVLADFSVPEQAQRWHYRQRPPEGLAARVPTLVPLAIRELTQAGGADALVVLRATTGWRSNVVTLSLHGDGLRGDGLVARRAERSETRNVPALPRPWWQRLPDLELLRTDRLPAAAVHPLVRAALFPDQVEVEFQPLESPVDGATVAVRCRGVWHQVGWRAGRVEPRDHTPEETQREQVMRSLGGEVPPCFTVTESWQGAVASRLPRRLRELRHHGLSAIAHGDSDALVRLLDRGVDPNGLRDRWDRGPLHHLAKVDGERLVGRLVAAGLDVNGRDRKGRTPLGNVLFDGGSAALVRALLDAGADAAAVDETGGTALHLLRSTDAAIIVPWLVEAGVGLEARDEYGRTPLMTQVLSEAPVEALRATLAAGADPGATDEYTDQSLSEMVEHIGRDDLDFLTQAVMPRSDGAQ